ncbi:MAG: hypothetical protein PHT12_01140 [Patescibacteria group bacterium]|nr:hypothetical protein [Patescibacteria group bacterium]
MSKETARHEQRGEPSDRAHRAANDGSRNSRVQGVKPRRENSKAEPPTEPVKLTFRMMGGSPVASYRNRAVRPASGASVTLNQEASYDLVGSSGGWLARPAKHQPKAAANVAVAPVKPADAKPAPAAVEKSAAKPPPKKLFTYPACVVGGIPLPETVAPWRPKMFTIRRRPLLRRIEFIAWTTVKTEAPVVAEKPAVVRHPKPAKRRIGADVWQESWKAGMAQPDWSVLPFDYIESRVALLRRARKQDEPVLLNDALSLPQVPGSVYEQPGGFSAAELEWLGANPKNGQPVRRQRHRNRRK